MKRIKLWIASALLISSVSMLRADDNQYVYSVSTGILPVMKLDAATGEIKTKASKFTVLTPVVIDVTNVSTMTTPAILQALYVKGNDIINLELKAEIATQTITTSQSLNEIESLWSEWQKNFYTSPLLKAYSPSIKKNTYKTDEGFFSEVQLKKKNSKNSYHFVERIPLTDSKKNLKDIKSDLKALNKFIGFLESDKRSQTILTNNKSQTPVFLVLRADGMWEAHHPFHSIIWDPKTRKARYEYSDRYSDVQNLWEVKELRKDKELASFIDNAAGEAQIKMIFISKRDYAADVVNRKTREVKRIEKGTAQFPKLTENK